DLAIYTGKEVDSVYLSDKAAATDVEVVSEATAQWQKGDISLEQQIDAGTVLYKGTCSVCHQNSGEGVANVFPPLANSDYLNTDHRRAIEIVLNGLHGPITVNGQTYNSGMPPMSQRNDDEVANILTYILNSWKNKGGRISAEEVANIRATTERPAGAAE